jgi:hypothetical protein
VSHDFPSPVIWICEVAMLCAKIVTFDFSSPVGGYAVFYPIAKFHVAVYLLLTRGLLQLLGASLHVDLQVLVA